MKQKWSDIEARKHLIDDDWAPWKPFRGKYPEPTPLERLWRREFLIEYDIEKDDFVEDDKWRSVEKKIGIPNVRPVLLRYLHEVRESKGYEVSVDVNIFRTRFYSIPLPPVSRDYEYFYEDALEMNLPIPCGKRYDFVRLDRFVWIRTNRMSLTVEELCVDVDVDEDNDIDIDAEAEAIGGGEADAHGVFKTIRAAVFCDVNTPVFDDWYFKQ